MLPHRTPKEFWKRGSAYFMGRKTEAQEVYPDLGLEGVRCRAWDTSERDKPSSTARFLLWKSERMRRGPPCSAILASGL